MRFRKKFVASVLALASLLFPAVLRAQDFGVGVAVSGQVAVGTNFTYSILITNLFPSQNPFTLVTNSFSSPITLTGSDVQIPPGAPGAPGSGATNSGNATVIAVIQNLAGAGGIAQLNVTVAPSVAGPLTNTITVAAFNRFSDITNVVVQVGNIGADLAVGLTNAASVVINDTTTISLSASNVGTTSVSGVVVTNFLPSSFRLTSVPANTTVAGGILRWNVGTLAAGASAQLAVNVQPTNAGTFNVAARIAGDLADTNSVNNVISNTMQVGSFLASDLSVTELSQQFNPQTGLREMVVRLSNNASTNVSAARVIVSNLASGTRLYNAFGTNAGSPFVLHNTTLEGEDSVDLLLEFYMLMRGPVTNVNLGAVAVPLNTFTIPTNAPIGITNFFLSSDVFLIEFPATNGRTYRVIYADDATFNNALLAHPPIVAPANRVQWIDNGPPKTISRPPGAGSRFYKVVEVQ